MPNDPIPTDPVIAAYQRLQTDAASLAVDRDDLTAKAAVLATATNDVAVATSTVSAAVQKQAEDKSALIDLINSTFP